MDYIKIVLFLVLSPFVSVAILFLVAWGWIMLKKIWSHPLPSKRKSLRWTEKKGWHHG